ncbi:spore germination protein KB [Paenibacillus cellulosilyticus]|uniref:Spore germination protein KB n=1 Tax=Paenibacillus cellulosilyticus TaxID=375489 RepID=A0A2V2Z1Y1_9BACL|nr:endospore germination permease [Paenibacillus cellulosilyticus]PWW08286.1 spore germination protein KB [Paenibacillus cellulosilyticus]QKS47886.1 endospore germination permease [Paenibacillus cellulosilyticus]
MKPEISTLQTVAIVINTITPTALLSIPSVTIGFAANDAWISVLIAAVAGVIIAITIAAICKTNPGFLFIEWMENRFGRIVGMVVGLLLGVYYFNSFCMIVRQFANFIADMVLDETPIVMLIAVMVGVAAFSIAHGIEAVARSAALVMFMVILVIPVSVGLNFDDINLKKLLPFFDAGTSRIGLAAISPIGWLSEISILLILQPYMKNPKSVMKAGIIGSLGSAAQLLIVTVMAVSVFGSEVVRMMSYPLFNMVGIVEVGKFLERIEIYTVSVWGMTMYVKMSVFLFASVHCITYTFRLKSIRHTLFSISLLAIVTTIVTWTRNLELGRFVIVDSIPFLSMFNIILPLCIGFCLLVTRGNNSKKGAQSS